MKYNVKKMIACLLCAALTFGSMQSSVFAASAAQEKEEAAVSKEETVYVLTGADGSTENVIVSDWLKNPAKEETISEKSELTQVENVKGDETYTAGAGQTRVWNAGGNDIYYQGSSEKKPPVRLSIRYELDGKAISPEELAGKSGRVRIRFSYTNEQYETVTVNGKEEKLHVPFVVLTGMILDDEVFSHVEVTNGKLVNDGNHSAVVGIAFPGLGENLNLPQGAPEIPEYIEVTADVENFAMGMTLSVVTNEALNQIDIEKLDSLENLKASMQKLTDAMTQLIDGSSELYQGLTTLLEKSGTLMDGINRLASGAAALCSGTHDLKAGALQLYSGASQLKEGLDTLVSNSSQLTAGAAQVFNTLLSTAAAQLQEAGLSVPAMTIDNYAAVLNQIIGSLDQTAVYQQALAQVTAVVEAKRPEIAAAVEAAVKEGVLAKVQSAVSEQVELQVTEVTRETMKDQVILTATGMDRAAYEAAVAAGSISAEQQQGVEAAVQQQMETEAVQNQIGEAIKQQLASEAVQGMITQQVAAQLQSDEVKGMIAANTEAQVQKVISENMASDAVQSQLTAASEGAKAVIALKASLDSYNAFYLGLYAYTDGVAEAASGAGQLKSGAAALNNGADALDQGAGELYSGLLTVQNAAPALIEGITQLKNGSERLANGLKELNEQGIQKLVDALENNEQLGDVDILLERIKASVEISKQYQSFSGISDEMKGTVKFIYRTAAIEAENE